MKNCSCSISWKSEIKTRSCSFQIRNRHPKKQMCALPFHQDSADLKLIYTIRGSGKAHKSNAAKAWQRGHLKQFLHYATMSIKRRQLPMWPRVAGEVQQRARRHHNMSQRITQDGGQTRSTVSHLRKAKCVNGCSALASSAIYFNMTWEKTQSRYINLGASYTSCRLAPVVMGEALPL